MTERRRHKRHNKIEQQEFREELKPLTRGHKDYIRAISENIVTFVTGPAGCGKSYIALGLASQYLLEGRIEKIVVARPTIEASKKGLGYLPGSRIEKLEPYLIPAIEHLKRFLGKNKYALELNRGNIRFEALEYMRGLTFDHSMLLLEEAQNATTEQIKMFVSRIGKESKIIIGGDAEQSDIYKENGATDLEYVISKIEDARLDNFSYIQMTDLDIVRHPIIANFLRVLR